MNLQVLSFAHVTRRLFRPVWKFALPILIILFATPAFAQGPSVEGQWQYDGFFYDGVRYPNPNPDLVLVFTFYDDGLSWLYWYRRNETGFCESLSHFTSEQNTLAQKVIWENPLNSATCPQDNGSAPGDEISYTPYSIEGTELRLHLELDGKPFLYILKSIPEGGSTQEHETQSPEVRPEP